MSQAVQPTKVEPKPDFLKMLNASRDQIAKALPKHLTPDRMMRIALTEFRKTPLLQKCDPVTVISAIVQAAQLGLEPGSALGHCFLVPFWSSKRSCYECQLIPGYKGLVDLARRSGQVLDIYSKAVYVNDKFEYEYGLNQNLIHKPAEGDRGELTHVYAVVKFKGGGSGFEVLSRREVEKIRDGLKKQNDIWKDHFDEMARKTVVRRLAKYMPLSPEFIRMQELDDANCQGESQDLHLVAIEKGIVDAEYQVSSPVSDDAETPAQAIASEAKAAHDKNHAAMVKLLRDQIKQKVQKTPGRNILAEIGFSEATSVDDVQFENFSQDALAAVSQTLRALN